MLVDEVRKGMRVKSKDRKDVGTIAEVLPEVFVIERGIFFDDDYVCAKINVSGLTGDEVLLSLNASELLEDAGQPPERERGVSAGTTSTDAGEPRAGTSAMPAAGAGRDEAAEREKEGRDRDEEQARP